MIDPIQPGEPMANPNPPPVYHEDTCTSEEYRIRGTSTWGTRTQTLCGEWHTVCEDDPNYRPIWRWDNPILDAGPLCPQPVTCPACLTALAAGGEE